ncbi:IPT/TIG domain-containing protein [Iodobacter sp.]|uniref:IPT/TIG domain-containing protein n=1 Tax=Iodobacter sp. TaxID=1915058 RepID=UPI0025DDA935|nr:IPT/TIG domain-containing protein [Iodobacter sp.]
MLNDAAQSGELELRKENSSVQARQRVIIAEPRVLELSGTELNTGETLILRGRQLNQLKSVRLGGVMLPGIKQSATEYYVSIPDTARSGYLTLEDKRGRQQTLPQVMQIWRPVAQPELRPAFGFAGQTISITGQGIDQVEQLLFTPNQRATIKSRSENRLEVEIPEKALSGPLTFAWDKNTLTSQVRFEIATQISATGMSPLSGPANTLLTISGNGLDAVSSASIGGINAQLISKTASSITLLTPANGEGEVVLKGSMQQLVSAGYFRLVKPVAPPVAPPGTTPTTPPVTPPTAPKATIELESIALVQNYSQLAGAQYQRLVQGKPAIVRANISSRSSKLASPRVWLSATINGVPQGQAIAMTGPATVPASVSQAKLEQSFNARLPEQWIKPGLSLRIEADPELQVSSGASKTITPVVGKPSNMDLVVVPLQLDDDGRGAAIRAQAPATAAVRQMLSRVFPLADSTVNVTIRGAYRVSSIQSTQSMKYIDNTRTGSAGWSSVLAELEQLRVKEGNARHYYGLVPDPDFSGGTAGLGYVNAKNTSYSAHSAIGLDARHDDDLSTMGHELGHNLSRSHAPCGGVSSYDINFPYAGGKIGNTLPYDPQTNTLLTLDEDNNGDLMGYCGGKWFSDYNYSKIQDYLEQRNYDQPKLAGFSMPMSLMDISGRISAGGASINPVSLRSGTATEASKGEYELHIVSASGKTIIQPFSPVEVADMPQAEQHFFVSIPKVNSIIAIEVWRKGKQLGSSKLQSSAGVGAGTANGAQLQWQESAGKLQIRWNAGQYPHLSVLFSGKTRQVLANQAQGGLLTVDTKVLPAGGQFEISLSDGLNPRLMYIKR